MFTTKIKKAITMIIFLFLSGNFISFIGLAKGRNMALTLSRPRGAMSWETSQEMITGCTYIPITMGISLIVLSLVFSTVLFIGWIRNNQ